MTEIKFQRLKYKIFGKTDEEVEIMIKPLQERYAPIRQLKKNTNYLAIIKYLLYLYDPGTDLNQEFVRLEDRKNAAASYSGLSKILGKVKDQVFDCEHSDALEVIYILLTEIFHNRDYREWQTLHKELDEYTKARWEKVGGKKKKKKGKEDAAVDEDEDYETSSNSKSRLEALNEKSQLRKQCEEINERLDQLDRKIFGDNHDVKEVAYKARFLSPESYSRAAKQVG
jgi:hypothetical protein